MGLLGVYLNRLMASDDEKKRKEEEAKGRATYGGSMVNPTFGADQDDEGYLRNTNGVIIDQNDVNKYGTGPYITPGVQQWRYAPEESAHANAANAEFFNRPALAKVKADQDRQAFINTAGPGLRAMGEDPALAYSYNAAGYPTAGAFNTGMGEVARRPLVPMEALGQQVNRISEDQLKQDELRKRLEMGGGAITARAAVGKDTENALMSENAISKNLPDLKTSADVGDLRTTMLGNKLKQTSLVEQLQHPELLKSVATLALLDKKRDLTFGGNPRYDEKGFLPMDESGKITPVANPNIVDPLQAMLGGGTPAEQAALTAGIGKLKPAMSAGGFRQPSASRPAIAVSDSPTVGRFSSPQLGLSYNPKPIAVDESYGGMFGKKQPTTLQDLLQMFSKYLPKEALYH